MAEVSPNGTKKRTPDTTKIPPSTLRRAPSLGVAEPEKLDARKLKISLLEKEKQLAFLEQQLSISQAHTEELKAESEKHKREEREAKKTLFAKDSHLRRQTLELKCADVKIQKFLSREDVKIRRSTMERKELEAELERLEDEHEESMMKALVDIKQLEDALSTSKEESSAQLAIELGAINQKTCEMAERYSIELSSFSDAVNQLKNQTNNLVAENTELKSELSKTTMESSSSMPVESSLGHNLKPISLEEDPSGKIGHQNSEIMRLKERNSKLQQLVEDLSLEKSSTKSEKEIELAEFMMLSHQKVQKLQLEKADKYLSPSSDIGRSSEDLEMPTSSVTELWKTLRALQLSEKTAKADLEQAFKMLQVADTELHSKVISLKALRDVKLLTDKDLLDAEDKIARLSEINRTLECEVKATRSDGQATSKNSVVQQIPISDVEDKNVILSKQNSLRIVRPSSGKKILSVSEKVSPSKATPVRAPSEKALDRTSLTAQESLKVQLEEMRKQNESALAKCTALEVESCTKTQQLLIAQVEKEEAVLALKVSNDMKAKLTTDLLEADNRTTVVERSYNVLEDMLKDAKDKLAGIQKNAEVVKEQLVFSQKNAEGLRGQLTGSKQSAESLKSELLVSKKSSTALMEELLVGQRTAEMMKMEHDNLQKSPETLRCELVISQQSVSALRWDVNLRQKTFDIQKGELAAAQQTLALKSKDLDVSEASLKKCSEDLALAVSGDVQLCFHCFALFMSMMSCASNIVSCP